MTTATCLWFAGFFALVLMSEAHLGRPSKPHVRGAPTKFYQVKAPDALERKITADKRNGYFVTAKLSESELLELSTELLSKINNHRFELPDFALSVGPEDLRLSGIVVPIPYFEVRGVHLDYGPLESLNLTFVVPKIKTTFGRGTCQTPLRRTGLCTFIIQFHDIEVIMSGRWSTKGIGSRYIWSGEIWSFNPRAIETQFLIENIPSTKKVYVAAELTNFLNATKEQIRPLIGDIFKRDLARYIFG